MIVGTVKETKTEEYRVALTPAGVADIVRAGHTVLVEQDAGAGSSYADEEYREAGAEVVATPDAVYAQAELVCEVKEPQASEFELLREGQLIFTYLHLAAEPTVTEALLRSRCIAIGYETVCRDDGFLPLLAPMSEVAGRMAVEIAAHHLKKPGPGRGQLLGGLPGVPPAHVVIVGSGNVGRNACRAAVGAGARVTVISIDEDQLRALEDQHAGRVETLLASPTAIAESVA
ncbi:MAG: NAD(P)-dependent oxidoreductase, partial [Dehalococcoidia bacterium]